MSVAGGAGGWLAFWNGAHSLYVSERHRRVHYARIADDILALAPGAAAQVLDFGCGEALDAPRIAAAVGRLWLAEAAEAPRAALAARLESVPGITVIPADAVPDLSDGSLDLIVVNSVAQYLTPAELDGWLAVFRTKLAPGGRLILADIIPPDAGTLDDVKALLAGARKHGFLLHALKGLALTLASDYRRLRRDLGLTRYTERDMLAKLAAAGLAAARHRPNLGFNQGRMAFVAQNAPTATPSTR